MTRIAVIALAGALLSACTMSGNAALFRVEIVNNCESGSTCIITAPQAGSPTINPVLTASALWGL